MPIDKRRKSRSKTLHKNSKSSRRASCPKAIQMAERISEVMKQRSCGAKCKNRKNLSKESILKSFDILNRDCVENNSTCDECGAKMLSDLGRISKGKPSRDPGSLLNVLRIEHLNRTLTKRSFSPIRNRHRGHYLGYVVTSKSRYG